MHTEAKEKNPKGFAFIVWLAMAKEPLSSGATESLLIESLEATPTQRARRELGARAVKSHPFFLILLFSLVLPWMVSSLLVVCTSSFLLFTSHC